MHISAIRKRTKSVGTDFNLTDENIFIVVEQIHAHLDNHKPSNYTDLIDLIEYKLSKNIWKDTVTSPKNKSM
jgi:hypothetical protein